VGEDADPDEPEVAEVDRVREDHRQHREVVERLAVFPERGVDVREQRPERDGDEHLCDGDERVDVSCGLDDVAQADTEQDGVQDVTLFVHLLPRT
jgi:hypothetical protein